jgi:sugar lactone lactonase YvrE
MNNLKQTLFIVLLLLQSNYLIGLPGVSFYKEKPNDPEAVYFTSEHFKIAIDGKTNVTAALQKAIDDLKQEKNFGIIFIPEGKYLLDNTIYIPKAIRLIGYGKKRPEFILAANTPGFREAPSEDKGKARYLFWFTSRMFHSDETSVPDANAGTFYSAFSNINIRIEKGNPAAIALRTHFAQHSFVAHCDIQIGEARAGIFDVGNFMEDVRFYGGDYGIITTKTSPGWQFMMLDTYFEDQRKSAVYTQEAGLTIVRMQAKNVPHVIEIRPDYWEKLFMEDCRFEDVSESALVISNENNDHNQISLLNVICHNVPVLAMYRKSNTTTAGVGKIYRVKKFVYGLHIDDLGAAPIYKTSLDLESLQSLPDPVPSDIPEMPLMSEWVNLKELGAAGDNETDNSDILQKAVDDHQVIYIPQGWYRLTRPVKLKKNTVLIGLNPVATQLVIHDNTLAFSGFGTPVPMLEVPEGGNTIVTGIGISTGDYNSRAVACKWMGGEKSYMNDVKFLGGHGDMDKVPLKPQADRQREMTKENRIRRAEDPAWDTQYWSLWITSGGGGIFADIWSASTFATNGIYINKTQTPGKIYALSVEHHMRNEVRINKVANWRFYALQLEEESREGRECQPLEIQESNHLLFANFYTFRVIRVKTPFFSSIRSWNSFDIEILNFHNYAQTKYSFTNSLYDINLDIQVRPWEFARLYWTKKVPKKLVNDKVEEIARGFEFAEGSCSDSKGNVYFSESRLKRVYKWSVQDGNVSLIADFPWAPQALACDSEDNLLVVFRYDPQPGYLVDGKQETFNNPPDAAGTSFSGWGNSGFAVWVYSINPEDPEETIQLLHEQDMDSIKQVYKAIYPSNRWRDSHDYNEIVSEKPARCFVAPDGKTIFPVCYDLARANALVEAYPGKPVYATNEYDKRVVRFTVNDKGHLSNPTYFAEKGEYSTAVDKYGNLYVADGNIYVFSPEGKQTGTIEIPERPTTITIGGKEHNTLFVTTAGKLFKMNLKQK